MNDGAALFIRGEPLACRWEASALSNEWCNERRAAPLGSGDSEKAYFALIDALKHASYPLTQALDLAVCQA